MTSKKDNKIIDLATSSSNISRKIYSIRGQKVILDTDLAELYEVETKVLNQAVRRNSGRFPEDFMFQLSEEECDLLSQQNLRATIGRGEDVINPTLLQSTESL